MYLLLVGAAPIRLIPVAGLKNFPQPINYDRKTFHAAKEKSRILLILSNISDVEFMERPKLRFMEKVPQMPPNLKPPKMQKRLMLMRGPETVHNFLTHKQVIVMKC